MVKRSIALGVAALALALAGAPPASGQDVKIGALFAVTGPIANFVPPILESSKLVLRQVNEQGGMLNGRKLELIVADEQCNPQAAAAAAQKLINVDQVVAIVGALCSGATIGAANAAAIPAGVLMITPASASPRITDLKDNDFVFRTAASDAFQGKVLAEFLLRRGIKTVALTYMKNDYGVGLASAFRDAYVKAGGAIAGDLEHEEKRPSYRSELATLAKGKAEYLVMIAYANDSGPVILKQSLEGGFFKKFVGSVAIRDRKTLEQIGLKNLEGMIISAWGAHQGPSLDAYNAMMKAVAPDMVGKPFAAQAYDATFLAALAIEAAGSTDRTKVRDGLRAVSPATGGSPVMPGEWAKAKKLIADKQPIVYAGAAGTYRFDVAGDTVGVVDIYEIKGGEEVKLETIK